MPKKIAVMLDGGHLRVYAKKAGHDFRPDYIERIGLGCAAINEEIFRILYYDCAPYRGTLKLPVSGTSKTFIGNDGWVHELAKKNLFAIRRGVLKFRGFVPRRIPLAPSQLQDSDFSPQFEQKGVDMRIGLDMAVISGHRTVELIALATNDTDCIPAMKHARKSGIQVALVVVPGYSPAPELLAHCDFKRTIPWPASDRGCQL
jgi:uncharacterized LabA/DUF88 family protein